MKAESQKRVLVVEDEQKIAQVLLDYLHADGLEAIKVANGLEAVEHARQEPPVAILLDLMLPGLDGVGVCRAIREFSDVPIIMLTARVDEIDRLLGLETGADDYVCKPFSPREVVARVRAQIRRAEGMLVPKRLPWVVDDHQLRISWLGEWLNLTPLEFRLLRLMTSQPGRVYSRAQLLDVAHADMRDVNDRAVDSHVKNLRRKIQAVDPAGEPIASIYGVGYRVDLPD